MKYNIPPDYNVRFDCWHCQRPIIKCYEEIEKTNGYICPKCNQEVGPKNPQLIEALKNAEKEYQLTLNRFKKLK